MEKAIRTPKALVLGMPCAKFEVLKIYTERDITIKGIYLAFIHKKSAFMRARIGVLRQNYQRAEIIQPQTHGLWLPLVVCGCVNCIPLCANGNHGRPPLRIVNHTEHEVYLATPTEALVSRPPRFLLSNYHRP